MGLDSSPCNDSEGPHFTVQSFCVYCFPCLRDGIKPVVRLCHGAAGKGLAASDVGWRLLGYPLSVYLQVNRRYLPLTPLQSWARADMKSSGLLELAQWGV